jgi:hypothetical protein
LLITFLAITYWGATSCAIARGLHCASPAKATTIAWLSLHH